MGIMHSEWRDRLKHWTHTLTQDFTLPLGEIQWEGFQTMEQLPPQEAAKGPFRPMPAGTLWGRTYEYCWMRASVTLPEAAQGKRIVLCLQPGGESTLFVNGKAFGTYRAPWVKMPHHYIEDNVLCKEGKAGETFDILVEVYAGHFFPESVLGGVSVGPVLPGSYQDLLAEGKRATLGSCTYAIWNEDAYQLYMDVDTLTQLLSILPEGSLRADKVAKALENFTLSVDFEQPLQGRIRDYQAARALLAPALHAKNGTTAPMFYGIGNAHLDLAWLWPMAETYRKTARTFAAQLRLLEEYPSYKFLQSQAASYEMCKQHYPELYDRIKQAIKKGQWLAEGAMWVEPDTNMTSGESLIRQIIHGKRFFQQEFQINCELLWLPDTFGYSAALPQILNGCGVKYLVTQKIFWSYNEGDRFPYHYFTWRGMDGSETVSFLPTDYTYRTDPTQISSVWENRVQRRGLDAFLLPFGYGDGGGGPSRDYLEYALREDDLEGMPRVRMESPNRFFQEMEEAGGPQHTYVGELYFSAHRGVYTSQALVKKNNRLCEIALREAEMWATLASYGSYAYPLEKMDRLWKVLLLHQFHDILPGSSIGRVYEEAAKAHAQLLLDVQDITKDALACFAAGTGYTVFNSLSWPRTQITKLPIIYKDGAETADGEMVPVQLAKDGVLALVTIPSCGAITLYPGRKASSGPAVKAMLTQDGVVMENSKVIARINLEGEVVSFVLKSSGREFASSPMNRFLMFKDVPRKFDAWDIDSNYIRQPIQLTQPAQVIIACESGLRAAVRVTRQIENSVFTQDIVLDADSITLRFETQVDWHELHRLLKVSFPVEVQAEEAFNEIQFGFIARPAHRSRPYDQDRFEVCNHRYTALCDQNHGAAVLNDCKYGVSMEGSDIRLTLLRAAASPQMRADNGLNHFTYAFTAWEGPWMESPAVREGYALNVPLLGIEGAAKSFSAFSLSHDNIILDTVKPAEDGSGDLILRLYECKQAATSCTLSVSLPFVNVSVCDMLENPLSPCHFSQDQLSLTFRPFEVKTLRFSRG